MKNSMLKVVMTVCALCLISFVASATGETENSRAKNAEKLFVAKQYDKAAPLFAQLLSSNPKNYKYNYYYGICLLITGKDKNAAIPYLENAMQHPKTPEDIQYYYARALHYTYRFDEALQSFTEFNSIIGAKDAPRWGTPQLMEMCNNAKKHLDVTKLSMVTGETESAAYDFYSKYTFTASCGKLLSMPDDLIKSSKADEDERPTIFLSANGRVMYYSAMNDATNSRDIFRVEKDIDGNWTAPVALDGIVNTGSDELFPTCNNDGRVLYFSSRGQGSTGGFDIFKSYYNTMNKTWSAPENMGSPYNSPDDDFCFVASDNDRTAYFTSQRATGPGTYTVYKIPYVSTENLPIAINGKFNCVGQPDVKSVKLTITRENETSPLFNLTTDAATGAYAVELPSPGSYTFLVEAAGFNPHTEEVRFGEFSDRIYVQDIFLSKSVNGVEDIAISNRRLTETGIIDESMTAQFDEDENTSGVKYSDAELAAMRISGVKISHAHDHTAAVDPKEATSEMISDNSVVFKVQIGAFTKRKREIVQERLEKKTDKTMLSSYDDRTWLRFFMGQEMNYDSAINLRETLRQAGFQDAFIVAFRGNRPIRLTDAVRVAQR